AAIFVRELCGTRKSLDAYPIGAPGPMEIRERLMVRLRSRVRIECLQHAEDRRALAREKLPLRPSAKPLRVFVEDTGRIVIRIDRDRDHAEPFAIVAQLAAHAREGRGHHRTHGPTGREYEVECDGRLRGKDRAERDLLTSLIDERHVRHVIGAHRAFVPRIVAGRMIGAARTSPIRAHGPSITEDGESDGEKYSADREGHFACADYAVRMSAISSAFAIHSNKAIAKGARGSRSPQMLRRASVDVHTDISCVIHGKVALVTYPSFDLIECPFPLGAAWLGTDARVIARNHTASAILAERDGLVLAQGRLAATRAHEAFELNRLVSAACASDSGRENVGGVTRVTRSSRRRPVTLLVSPVRWPAPREDADIPAAIVFMNDPERKPVTWRDLLRRLYGLTRSEADVALLVLRGGRVGDIARERATSRSTV